MALFEAEFAPYGSSAGITLEEAVHTAIPGRGRTQNGMGISRISAARTIFGAEFYAAFAKETVGGRFVSSGYKSPSDKAGEPWIW